MIYQHPLAYLLGLEGLALLRGWAGDFDRDFVLERLAEVRRLLDHPALAGHEGVEVARGTARAGYAQWAASYDQPNALFDRDQPAVLEIVDRLPAGAALDAACGTGRYASLLVERGHAVVGVDGSPEMLDVARARVPSGDFRLGDLTALPIDDDAVDLVVCALAISHVADLGRVLRELARVLRPGGHLVISDAHHELVFRGSVVKALGPDGEPGLVATYRHTPGDYLRAALPLGLQVRRCEEPGLPASDPRVAPTAPTPAPPPGVEPGPWDQWPWSLLALVPDAVRAAWSTPSTIVWHFQLAP